MILQFLGLILLSLILMSLIWILIGNRIEKKRTEQLLKEYRFHIERAKRGER